MTRVCPQCSYESTLATPACPRCGASMDDRQLATGQDRPAGTNPGVERTVNRASLRSMGIGAYGPPMMGAAPPASPPVQEHVSAQVPPVGGAIPAFGPPDSPTTARSGACAAAQRLLFVFAGLAVVTFVVNLTMGSGQSWAGLVGGALAVAAGLEVVKAKPSAPTVWMVFLFIGATINLVLFIVATLTLFSIAQYLSGDAYLLVYLYAMAVLAFNSYALVKGALAFRGR